jgi:hypothetical protein
MRRFRVLNKQAYCACAFACFTFALLQAEPLKENNISAPLSSESSELFRKSEPPRQTCTVPGGIDRRQVEAEHWGSDVAFPARHQHGEAVSAPLQHQHSAFASAEPRRELHKNVGATAELVSVPFTTHGVVHQGPFKSTFPAQQSLPALPTDFPRVHPSSSYVNAQSRNPSPDLISEPEIHQLDDDINSVKALLQEQEPAIQPFKTGSPHVHSFRPHKPSPSISRVSSPYQKYSRTSLVSNPPLHQLSNSPNSK